MNTPKQPQPGSEPAQEALDNTSRPQPSQDRSDDDDRPTPDGGEDDESLRELKPRAIDRQFGAAPDIEPEANQQQGAKEWVDHSREMTDTFLQDDGKRA
jgi:hypothetical protein